jgi:class 3 adenylate cyclase/CheY-like chemotaxis protein
VSKNEKGETVLVVDDDSFSRSLARSHLADLGYVNILIAETGKKALDILRTTKVDLMLLDMMMPDMSGLDVLREIKSDLALHGTPIIVISGENDLDTVVTAIELGAEDYLSKPVNAGMLGARLRNVLERLRLRAFEQSSIEALRAEKRRADALLDVILPAVVARELKTGGTVEPRMCDDVAILFCDIVGFTSFCSSHSPKEVLAVLQKLFVTYEGIAKRNQVEKIKTIGDAFMGAASLTTSVTDPLRCAVACGLGFIEATREVWPGHDVRVGVAEGSVIAGIVGGDKYQYDVWGDTVNVAARMASVSRPGVVTLPHESWIRSSGSYAGRLLGEVDVKGKGMMRVVECTGMSPALYA